jgi:hypothetical protein
LVARRQCSRRPDAGVICETWALEAVVIPAKAGIQSLDSAFPQVCRVDSRFRGNDWRFERDPIPNDTATEGRRHGNREEEMETGNW